MAKTAAPAAGEAPAKKGKKTLVVALAALLLGAGGAGGAWFFLFKGKGAEDAAAAKAAEKKPEKKTPVFVNLDPFTVNLRDEDGSHYLQVGIVLEASDAATVDQIKLHMPVIRNRVLLLLSSKHAEEILTVQGKQRLAEEIAAESRAPLALAGDAKGVEGVYFASFVVQ